MQFSPKWTEPEIFAFAKMTVDPVLTADDDGCTLLALWPPDVL